MDQWEAEVVCVRPIRRENPVWVWIEPHFGGKQEFHTWWKNLEQLWNKIKEVQNFVNRMSGDEETSLQELYTKAANAKRALTRAKKELQNALKTLTEAASSQHFFEDTEGL